MLYSTALSPKLSVEDYKSGLSAASKTLSPHCRAADAGVIPRHSPAGRQQDLAGRKRARGGTPPDSAPLARTTCRKALPKSRRWRSGPSNGISSAAAKQQDASGGQPLCVGAFHRPAEDRRASVVAQRGRSSAALQVCIQVNVSGEASKRAACARPSCPNWPGGGGPAAARCAARPDGDSRTHSDVACSATRFASCAHCATGSTPTGLISTPCRWACPTTWADRRRLDDGPCRHRDLRIARARTGRKLIHPARGAALPGVSNQFPIDGNRNDENHLPGRRQHGSSPHRSDWSSGALTRQACRWVEPTAGRARASKAVSACGADAARRRRRWPAMCWCWRSSPAAPKAAVAPIAGRLSSQVVVSIAAGLRLADIAAGWAITANWCAPCPTRRR